MVQQSSPCRVVRPAEAATRLGIGLSTLWLKTGTDPDFPRPFKTGPRTTVFYEHELDAYLARCAARSRNQIPVTVLMEADLDACLAACAAKPRVTRTGRILRKPK